MSWLIDLRIALAFLTRAPTPRRADDRPSDLARAGRVFPLVGAAIGGTIGALYWGLLSLHAPPIAAAALALGAGYWLTGALHEDGLADLADGFGGGRSRERKLEIMRDSAVGSYGALALVVVFAGKLGALAALPGEPALAALAAAHALARASLPLLSRWLPLARSDGLAASVGATSAAVAATALALGAIVAVAILPLVSAVLALAAALIATGAVGWLAWRQIGGRTGDVLGAAEQAAELAVLLVLAMRLA